MVAIVTHHDAAHTGAGAGLLAHPLVRPDFPESLERGRKWPGLDWLTFAAPVLVGLGSLLGSRRLRRVGGVMGAGGALTFADVARSLPSSPAPTTTSAPSPAMLEVGRALQEEPVEGVKVLLVAPGVRGVLRRRAWSAFVKTARARAAEGPHRPHRPSTPSARPT